jgi:stage II sporulation protein AA (anti-sigma F factor antagonist)
MADVNQPSTATVARTDDGSGPPVIHLGGELDISNIPTVETELESLLATAGRRAVFDLSALQFMDSSGIALLLRAREQVGDVVVRNPSAVVQRIIEATGLSDTLPIEPIEPIEPGPIPT